MTEVDLAEDLRQRFVPSARQLEVTNAIIKGGAAEKVIVPITLPGKQRGWWTSEQVVQHPEGFWTVPVGDDGQGYSTARHGADMAAGAALDGAEGVAAYAVIYPHGEFAVFEGISGRRAE